MGLIKWFMDTFLTTVTENSSPEVVFLSDLHTWIGQRVHAIKSSNSSNVQENSLLQAKHLRTIMSLADELKEIDSTKSKKLTQLDISLQRLNILSSQKDEKEISLIKAKDSVEFRELSDTFEKEKELLTKREELDDELFLLLVRIKTSLSELQDFNSNYELLEVMKTVTSVQENFLLFFDDVKYRELHAKLRWVQDSLNIGTLKEKEGGQYAFHALFETFQSGNFIRKRQMRINCKNELDDHRKMRLSKGIFSKIEDLQYRIDHFAEQQEALTMHTSALSADIEELKIIFEKKKEMFEILVQNVLQRKITLALSSSL